MTSCWANHDEASSGVFESVHRGLTVQQIATPRDRLMTCKSGDAASLVLAQNTDCYDFIPVIDAAAPEERIIGLFNAGRFAEAPRPEGSVASHMLPLAEDNLIGADASILDFIIYAHSRPCRLLVAGARISGLVSLSDLQKLPVRAALFALITGFEIIMAEAIRRRYPAPEDWMAFLNDGRKGKIREQIANAKKEDSFVDELLFTQFSDKADIIRKAFALSASKSQLEGQLSEIRDLRDALAHANEYASSPEQAKRVCQIVRNLLALKDELTAKSTQQRHEVA
ncbi:MAG: hypothetical protein ACREDO_01180 [Methyloceanibacter sp.]